MPASSLSLPNFRPWVCFPHGWPTEPPWACLDCFVLHASQDQQQIPCHPTVFELITFHVFFHGFGSQHLPLCLRYWRRLLLIFLLLSSCPDPHRRHSKFYKYLFLIMYMHVCLSVVCAHECRAYIAWKRTFGSLKLEWSCESPHMGQFWEPSLRPFQSLQRQSWKF